MCASGKSLAWLVLASYLFANTAAVAFHDHGDCCGHSEAEHHHADDGAAANPATDCEVEWDEDEGDELHAPHHCVVCDFLAQAPLGSPIAALIPVGDLALDVARPSAGRLTPIAATTHLPRGPPA